MMTKDDVATVTMFLSDDLKENGLKPLLYKMNVSKLTGDSVDVEFKNSTGKSRSFRIKIEAINDDGALTSREIQ